MRRIRKKQKQKPLESPPQNEPVETVGNNQLEASNGSDNTGQRQNIFKELNTIKGRVNQVYKLCL